MRYVLDTEGYIAFISLDVELPLESELGPCHEYTGTIPEGYDNFYDWQCNANTRAYKIVDGNLVYDASKDKELQLLFEKEAHDNSFVTHKELYGLQIEAIQNYLDAPYTKAYADGNIITLNDVKKVYPKIKISNIDCYSFSNIDLIVTKKNILPNEALSMKLNGLKFKQNLDRSISINGTSKAETEYSISGSSDNTSPFLCFKKNQNYFLSSNNKQIKMYFYDGADRSEIYSGTGGVINFTDEDKLVTHITLVIPTNTKIKETIYPQLELGTEATDYEMYEANYLSIDFSEYVEEGLYPSDDLFPCDELFPFGTTIDYVLLDKGKINLLINEEEIEIENNNVSLLDGNNTIYTLQDTYIEIDYCINNLELEGTATKNNNFKILEDGSIEAHNGLFSGKVEATEGEIGGFDLGIESFTSDIVPKKDYTEEDVYKLSKYTVEGTGLTDKEKELYDVTGDGLLKVNDVILMQTLISTNVSTTKPGKLEINSKNPTKTILIKDGDGKEVVKLGLLGIETPELKAGKLNVSGGNVVLEVNIWEATGSEPELGSYGIVERDFSAYKYVDVYFRAVGVQSGETNGNGISNVLRIDLGMPSTYPIITKDGVTYHYGASNMYPDAQFFVGVTNDPGFFMEGAFIDWHKSKLMVGNLGYYIISRENIGAVYSDAYEKVYKVVGYL